MLIKPAIALFCAVLLLGGCAEFEAWSSSLNAPATPTVTTEQVNKLYVTPSAPADIASFRNIYIAPANLANMQVIQPEGTPANPEWWVTDEEGAVLQRTIAFEFSIALTAQSDFTIVSSPQQAQLIVNTAVVAVHPNETRASLAKDLNTGGSITVSVAVADAASGLVLLRSVDTRESEDIWAFNEITGEDPAFNGVFATWGVDLRRGILELQGHSAEVLLPSPVSSAQN
tara:strand:+ start:35268 stop:35954 length:687 start_codon:yes stop_codon:yes gene_type:complete